MAVEFTPAETEYLRSQRLARVATASREGEVDVAPIGLHFDGQTFTVVGIDITQTLKYQNARQNSRAALVADDLASVDPWRPRGVKVHGDVEVVDQGERPTLKITPTRKWSWGINA